MITPAYSPTATERVLPRLALDFTTGVLDGRVTVTRALNTATRVNSSGYVEGVNANLPRFDYDPVTLAPKGLLIEETRTNVILQSENFGDTAWTTNGLNINVSTDAAVSPANTQTADTLVPTTTSGSHRVAQLRTGLTSSSYTASLYVKASGYSKFAIVENAVTGAYVSFDCAGSGSKLTESGATGSITAVGNGWFRVTMNIAAAQTGYRFDIYILPDSYTSGIYTGAWAGDGVKGIYAWGAQLEAGAFATSYIPTTTTSLTRNFDQVKMTGTNFSSWYNASEGTFTGIISDFSNTWAGGYVAGNNTDHIGVYRNGTTGAATNVVKTSSSFQALLASGTWANNTQLTFANSYKANAFAFSSYANVPATDAAGTVPTVSELQLGYTYGVAQLNGHIVKFNYYPQALTLNEVRAFSK